MHPWLHVIPAVSLALTACATGGVNLPPPPASSASPSPPVRAFLTDGSDEDLPGPLHAYLLLPQTPAHGGQRLRIRAERLAEAFWHALEALPGGAARGQGTVYWLVRGISEAEAVRAADRDGWPRLVEAYHAQRAEVIRDRLGGLPGVGPHLVVARRPLSRMVSPPESPASFMVVDFSVIPEDRFGLVVDAFAREVLCRPESAGQDWPQARLQQALEPIVGMESANAVWVRTP